MMATMKQAKTMPKGGLAGIRTGVQRKTKMYMQDSTMVWMPPRMKMTLSLVI